MVSYEGEKMSKSLGNLVFVSDLLEKADPARSGSRCMRHHYRAGFEWYDTDLDEGTALLHRLARGRAPRARARSAPVRRRRCAPRSTTTSTRPARSRRSTTSPSAILSGGDDSRRPAALRELAELLGVDLDVRAMRPTRADA